MYKLYIFKVNSAIMVSISSDKRRTVIDVLLGGVLAMRGAQPKNKLTLVPSIVWLTAYAFLFLTILYWWEIYFFGDRAALNVRGLENLSQTLAYCGTFGLILNIPLARAATAVQPKRSLIGAVILVICMSLAAVTFFVDNSVSNSIWKAQGAKAQEALYEKLDKIPRGPRQ